MALRTPTYWKRRQLAAYIGDSPSTIVLSRKIRTPTPGGTGYVETPTNLPPQIFRINDIGSRQQPTVTTQGGQVIKVDADMIGDFDADVQIGDTFTTTRGKWQVVFVGIKNDVRTACSVRFLGT